MKDQIKPPLRLVLRNFLNHIENLESQSCPEESYEKEFQDLKLFSENVKTLKEYSCLEGEKETNKKKNRYKDILPFDISRVVLNEYAGIPGSDYINANYIKGASGSPAYIASQGPLPSTVNDFWRMVVQCEVQVIVMACNEEEAGKAKCEKYWVDEGEEKQFGMISVKLLKASTVCPDFSVRTMRLKYTNSQNVIEERTVCQLHYVAWPDHGVPTVVQPLLEMVRLVRDTQASETLPVLVHCSAGCGRTGTICAIDYVWGLLRTGKLTVDFSLLALIREMRKQRIAMVQTKEQYVLVHQAVRELFKEQLCMIDSHPYENVDPDGLLIIKVVENDYDTIENVMTPSSEEKKDKKMEKDVAPPLPQKKHTLFSSKREKDVENLSAQKRDVHSTPKSTPAMSHPRSQIKPKPMAGKATNSPMESSSLTPFKNAAPKPIPSRGILRVPQIESIKSVNPVKRSKSLKVVSSGNKQKLSFSADIPIEPKRRLSLESNIEESVSTLPISDDTSKNSIEDITSKDDMTRISSSKTTKYDAYLDDKRLLVRSFTTLDMRKKLSEPPVPSSKVSSEPDPPKCKLARSNTQIEFTKMSSTPRRNETHKRIPTSNGYVESINSFQTPTTSGRSRGVTPRASTREHSSTTKRPPMETMTNGGVPLYAMKRSPVTPKNGALRMVAKPSPVYQHQLDPTKSKQLPYYNEEAYQMTRNGGKYVDSGFKHSPRNLQFTGRSDALYHQMSSPSSSSSSSDSKPLNPSLMDKYKVIYEPLCRERPPPPPALNPDPLRHPRQKHRSDFFTKHSEILDPRQSVIYGMSQRAAPPPSSFYSPSVSRIESDASARPNDFCDYGKCSSSSKVPFKGQYKALPSTNKIVLDSEHQSPKYDYTPPPPKPWHMTPSSHYETPPYEAASYGSSLENTPHRPTAAKPVREDNPCPKDYFLTAPGVDIDQVAASIPQKDGSKNNLMKVALEAFNIRKTKQQSRQAEASSSSSSPAVNGKVKKKQQQYL